ncbi:hypothetical protein [Bacillus dakarensis]|uniref:hypothetical protein n=1 Tax=Robertmurraya dakarensis TaxID=1926278 RepID=UPI0009824926|nr:hypothetical protein [Bacillus dakarensis]
MPRKSAQADENEKVQENQEEELIKQKYEDEIAKLNTMLAAVLKYLSDDDVEEIDIEVLLNNTEGLREWWDQYRERNRKQIEVEIQKSLSDLSLEELESIREQINEKKK